MSDHEYAGDKTPEEAWEVLASNPAAVLIDVRTDAEWAYVGTPDLSALNKEVVLAAWQEFPKMEINPEFVSQVSNSAPDQSTPLLFICRSGVRSKSAAAAVTSAGYSACFNVLEGFEGDKDGDGHRGAAGGWKYRGLPWKQC